MNRSISLWLAALMLVMPLIGIACAGDQQTPEAQVLLKGTVTPDNQFIDESGEAYKLAVNEKTAELMAQPGQTFEITGTLEEQQGEKILTITDFSVVSQ